MAIPKNSKKSIVFLLFVLFLSIAVNKVSAKTSLSSVFGDHMVLQRNTEVSVWGKDKPGTKILILPGWGEEVSTKTDNNGNWKTQISTNEAGGPYNLTISGSTSIEINDILLGEVWLCSGQSNMEMPLKGNKGQPVYGSNEAILNSSNQNLRFFTVGRNVSAEPLESCTGNWELSTPETAAEFSAVAYFYGSMLQEKLGVPVGLIQSSWGGTPAQAWTPGETLKSEFEEFEKEMADEDSYNQKTPTALYNGMINPLLPFTIKGVIWYQGEGNRYDPAQYERLFPAMIRSWRHIWEINFPFYFVQIAPFGWGGENLMPLQESQLKTMLEVPNTGMVVTLDIGQEDCIHPPEKKPVGERLAYWSLAKTYGFKGIQYCGPVYKSMEVKDSLVYLHFDYAPLGVSNMGKELKDFEIAGEDKIYHPARAKIVKGQLEVWSDEVSKPKAVRYAWKSYVEASLFNTAGLPASPFRTESFEKNKNP